MNNFLVPLVVEQTGTISCIYDETIDLTALGEFSIQDYITISEQLDYEFHG